MQRKAWHRRQRRDRCGLARSRREHGDVVMWARSEDVREPRAEKAQRRDARASSTDPRARSPTARSWSRPSPRTTAPRVRAPLDGAAGRGRDARHHDLLAVGRRARRGAGRPERFVGLHVFNPVPGCSSSSSSFRARGDRGHARAAARLCEHLGKTPVEVPDIPGFVVNRLLFPYLFSAVRLLEESGLDARGRRPVHEARRRPPDGPARPARLRRPRRRRSRSASRSAPTSPNASATLVAEGALGRKSGAGLLLLRRAQQILNCGLSVPVSAAIFDTA